MVYAGWQHRVRCFGGLGGFARIPVAVASVRAPHPNDPMDPSDEVGLPGSRLEASRPTGSTSSEDAVYMHVISIFYPSISLIGIYIYIYISSTCIYVHYIYIYRERERDREQYT